MARTETDYYELLGVSRGASEAEIKQSFRSLARELHPDVSSEPEAERRFREVAEAYEVLSDPERRSLYDRYGKAGLQRRGFEPAFSDFGSIADIFASFFGEDFGAATGRRGRQRGGDVQVVAEIDLEDAFTGVSARVPVEAAVPCERCDASGAEPRTGSRTCATCNGAGAVRSVSQNIFGQFVQQRACPDCGGSGAVLERPCSDCAGEGRRLVTRELQVDIPPGIHDGQQIRVRGEGHAGFRSAERGNAFVVVRVRPDPRFVRDGDDLHTAVRLTMTDAALGTTAKVASLSGDLEVEIPSGTQPGEVLVLRGEGMPALRGSRRGSLYVRLDIAVPTVLAPEERRLLEEVDRTLGPEAYRPKSDEGFFGRLKSALR
jgi:molecular chaperone DnaJ